mmetsp:Transcript_8058/g.11425  ORF Transcript_8058/g.11425 Transcript_8058/m.11425 type:complete len:247 (+) Transcript_8058:62-802(+)
MSSDNAAADTKLQVYTQLGNAAIDKLKKETLARDEEDTSVTNFMGYSSRLAGLIGGIATVLCALLGFFSSLIRLPVYLYVAVFGAMVVVMNMDGWFFNVGLSTWIAKEVRILTTLAGRGVFNIFIGTLLFWEWGLVPVLVGVYMILIGVLMIMMSLKTAAGLSEMRQRIVKESRLNAEIAFKKYDTDGNGHLDLEEFKKMASECGLNLRGNALVAAKNALDVDGNGTIDRKEFSIFIATEKAKSFV